MKRAWLKRYKYIEINLKNWHFWNPNILILKCLNFGLFWQTIYNTTYHKTQFTQCREMHKMNRLQNVTSQTLHNQTNNSACSTSSDRQQQGKHNDLVKPFKMSLAGCLCSERIGILNNTLTTKTISKLFTHILCVIQTDML